MQSPYIDSLLEEATDLSVCAAEISTAKEEFERTGMIRPEAPSFGERCNAFLNWFVLDRPLLQQKTPLEYYLEFNDSNLSPQQRRGYGELAGNIHSVFQLLHQGQKELVLKDLVQGYKYNVLATMQSTFLDVNSVLQTRLINHSGRMYFSNYMILHPSGVESLIKKQVQAKRSQRSNTTELMFNLMLYQSRWEQFEKMDPRRVYQFY